MAKTKNDLKAVITIESVAGPFFSKNSYGTKKYRTEAVGIATYPSGNPSGADIGKIRFVVFEVTTDNSSDPTKNPHFKVGDIIKVEKGDYTRISDIPLKFRTGIPTDAMGQIMCDLSDISLDTSISPKVVEESVETFFLKEDKKKLEAEIEELKKQKEAYENLQKKIKESEQSLREMERKAYELRDGEKKLSFETRKDLVNTLLDMLPIKDKDKVYELHIDLRYLRKGYEQAFMWK